MRKIILVLILLAMVGRAEETPDPREVSIESITNAGTGCPRGSTGRMLSADLKAFTFLFDRFSADGKGPGQGLVQKRCNIRLRLQVPPGWSVGVFSIDYRGYVKLDAGAKARQITHTVIQGEPSKFGRNVYLGPLEKDFYERDEIPLKKVDFASCQGRFRHILISTEIELRGYGTMSVDSTTGELTQKFGLKWKRCAPQESR